MKRCGKLYHLNYQIVFCKMLFSAAGFLFKKGAGVVSVVRKGSTVLYYK